MKTSIKTGLAALMLLAISCSKEFVHNPQESSTQIENNSAVEKMRHFIGERFGGGIIYYMNSTGKHGLIADTLDLQKAQWKNVTFIATGATATDLGAGKANTHKIIMTQGMDGNYAALECAQSRNGGYSDWVLPSLHELDELENQKELIGGFNGTNYWSSTEGSQNYSWVKNFKAGWHDQTQKGYIASVRAIRYY